MTGKEAILYKPIEGTERVMCTACARYCKVGRGQIGFCGVRQNVDGRLHLLVYGRVIAGHIDPIEKKPVTHYRPGSKIFSIATTGCSWACQYCFLPGTMVLTQSGHEKIDSIFAEGRPTENPEIRLVENRLALTHRGHWHRIVKAFEHLYSGPIVRIRPYYLPEFGCTREHEVFASIAGESVQKVRAGDLKIGDFVAVPRSKNPGRDTIDVETFLRARTAPAFKYRYELRTENGRVKWSSEKKGNGIPARLGLNPAIARLFGYYCAEGSVCWSAGRPNSGSVWFSFGGHEEKRIREVEQLLRSERSLRPYRSIQGNRTAVVASNGSLTALFEDLCGNSSATKRVPEVVLQCANPSVLMGFLTGYLNGDGYVTKGLKGQLILGSSSVSQALTYGVAHVLLALGYMPRVYQARNSPQYVIEGRTVSRSDDYMLRLWVDEVAVEPDGVSWKPSKVRILERPDYFLVPIRNILEEEYVGPVYNIEVEEDHSYTASFTAVANCQNFDISQRRKPEGLEATPEEVANMAVRYHVEGLAYTYNEPSIFIEYARDIGVEAHRHGIFNIFVSNGYDTPDSVKMMKDFLDCITVDFKGSGETGFVRRYIGIPNAQPIFDTLRELKEKTDIHVEITDLIVPQVGDNLDEARKLSKFVYDLFGPDMPIHFLRWHPDYKMMDLPMTPIPTLEKHCQAAKEVGLRYVYIGNVPGHPLEHTYCPGCGRIAIKRFGFDITGWNLDKDNKCKACGYQLPIVGPLADSVREDRFRPVIW